MFSSRRGQPEMLLKDFRRVEIPAGKSVQVSFRINSNELSILDRRMIRTVEKGTIEIRVGDSSATTLGVILSVEP